ncbi:hypothetical protein [Lysobacter silvisoli]|uniref:VCBS repeat-containing protein n=1 Tax=Lysobacter silvisoli TaxID=2293254 RepID=A0A371JZ18_9GAMM|nr:hypothetical protein [Lysobacter silvisoli]RDZ26923.1 hypothetical protein DX914_11650 [Lysobacter silvisoli]
MTHRSSLHSRKPTRYFGCAAIAGALWLSVACASQSAASDRTSARKDVDSDDLAAFVPSGTSLRTSARGDLDGDGDQDALLVLNPVAGGDAAFAPRTLLLLRRDAGGALRLAVSSPKAVLCRSCGGMSGDPLQGIDVKKGEFTLRFEGGSRELWSSEYRFAYRSQDDDWHLTEAVSRGFDRSDGKSAERKQGPIEFGDVALGEFDPKRFPADALP